MVRKALTSLQAKNLVKELVNCQNKAKKHYLASEFIEIVRNVCLKHIFTQKVATLDGILEWLKKSKVFSVEFSSHQIEEILRALVLDDKIVEVKSTGFDDFASIPVGRVCYRCKSKSGFKVEPKIGAMAPILCGVCPRIIYCTPDGIISPRTCVY